MHISEKLMSLYSICMVPVAGDMDIYLGNSHEYNQVHDQHPYITTFLDAYVHLMKLQLSYEWE